MLMTKAADLYYLRDLTQQEIAERLGISRPTVSRLLRRSRTTGIVRIQVIPPADSHHDLEHELEEGFGLREAVVIAAQPDSAEATQQALGQAGARYVERILKGGERIGISWGTTLRAVVDHLRPRPLSPSVVPLVGGLGQSEPVIHANDLAHRLAAVLGGDVHLLHAPAIVARRSVRRAMLSDGGIQRVLSMARQVQVALVGIGALVPTSTLVRSKYFGVRDLSRLRRRGAIGDICTRPFSRAGTPVDDALQGRILAVEFNDLKRIPTVVAVAGGVDKAEAIRGALEGHLVNVLVTDDLAARALLRARAARVESAR